MNPIPRQFKEYKVNRAKIAALEGEIEKLQLLAKQLEGDVGFRGVALYGEESRHSEGGHSDLTALEALREVPDDVRQLYDDIRILTIEKGRAAARVAIVERALDMLTDKQRIVVELRAIDGLSWEDVADGFLDRTEHEYTTRTLRTLFSNALTTINPFFRSEPIEGGNHREDPE